MKKKDIECLLGPPAIIPEDEYLKLKNIARLAHELTLTEDDDPCKRKAIKKVTSEYFYPLKQPRDFLSNNELYNIFCSGSQIPLGSLSNKHYPLWKRSIKIGICKVLLATLNYYKNQITKMEVEDGRFISALSLLNALLTGQEFDKKRLKEEDSGQAV